MKSEDRKQLNIFTARIAVMLESIDDLESMYHLEKSIAGLLENIQEKKKATLLLQMRNRIEKERKKQYIR